MSDTDAAEPRDANMAATESAHRNGDGLGRYWVGWFDARALAVLGALMVLLLGAAAIIAFRAHATPVPVAITRPVAGAALEAGQPSSVEGTASPGAWVKVYDSATFLGEAKADYLGKWRLALSPALAAGDHTLRADAVDSANRLTTTLVGWTLTDAAAAEAAPARPVPLTRTAPAADVTREAVPRVDMAGTAAPPAPIAPSFGVLPSVLPPANPIKAAPAGVKGPAYDAVTELAGTAGPSARVRLFDGDKAIGETTADAKGNWSFKLSAALPLGARSITASAVDGAVEGPRSVAQAFTVVSPQTAAAPVTPAFLPLDAGASFVAGQRIDLVGTAAPGAQVQIVGADGTALGTATAGADGKWLLKILATAGMGPLTARALGPAGALESAPLAVAVATPMPAPTAPAPTATPRVLLGVTGGSPAGGAPSSAIVGATGLMALALAAVARRRAR